MLPHAQTHLLEVVAGKPFSSKWHQEDLELRTPLSCLETKQCFRLPELQATSSHGMGKSATGKPAKLSAMRSQKPASLSTSAVGALPSHHISQALQTFSPSLFLVVPIFWRCHYVNILTASSPSLLGRGHMWHRVVWISCSVLQAWFLPAEITSAKSLEKGKCQASTRYN